MKISYNWLKEFIDIDLPAEETAQILTDIGLEVEGLETYESVKGGLNGLLVGEVKSCEKHPDADKLNLTTVDVGGEDLLNIVCGAPNVAAGQKVIVATNGATLYPINGDPFKIKKAKIRGVESNGMICAEDEIGLGESHDGIMVLNPETAVGTPISEIFEVTVDQIFEIGLTPNRSDAYSHIGVAKDLAAYLRYHGLKGKGYTKDVKLEDKGALPASNASLPISVEIKDDEKCQRYSGISISGVEIKASPNWMQHKLKAIGVNPINNIVDITNYILHETGQPLHAFDADAVSGQKVIVDTASEGDVFITLDENEVHLNAEDLMINNAEEGMCIAGVYGGLKSGVSDSTKNIFLESAHFEMGSLRRTSFRHLLRTDAAMRFEKGTDPNQTVDVLKRAAALILELAGGEIASDIVDVYPKEVSKAEIDIHLKNINRSTGVEFDMAEIKKILSALEIDVLSEEGETLKVAIPTNKVDVTREADVIEEILRIYGFNQVEIPAKLNASLSHRYGNMDGQKLDRVSEHLASQGYNEIMGISLTHSELTEKLGYGDITIPLLNSLNAHLDVMRPSMLFSGLAAIEFNQNRKNRNLRLYEQGKVYWSESLDGLEQDGDEASDSSEVSETVHKEKSQISIFITGDDVKTSWRAKGNPSDFYHIKSAVSSVLNEVGLNKYQMDSHSDETFLYGMKYFRGNQQIARFGLLHPKVQKLFSIKSAVFYAELEWDNILKATRKNTSKYEPVPKFPSMKRDLALMLDSQVSFKEIEALAQKNAKNILKDVHLFDIYTDEKMGADKKSYAVSFTFNDVHKTLTDKEVDKVMKNLISKFEGELKAELR